MPARIYEFMFARAQSGWSPIPPSATPPNRMKGTLSALSDFLVKMYIQIQISCLILLDSSVWVF